MVVVTRYFGGVKLGVGGLIRAYGGAAGEALDVFELEQISDRTVIGMEYAYSDSASVQAAMVRHHVEELESVYTGSVVRTVSLPPEVLEEFMLEVNERVSGRVGWLPNKEA